MQRKGAVLLFILICLSLLGGCGKQESKVFVDGTYTAEFENFDSYGYKDFIEVSVKDGVVTDVRYDGKAEDGALKTADEKYESDMQALNDTYPSKYTADLENQYLEKQNIDGVDALAGATYSSDSFKALFTALEVQMQAGDTTPLVVENVPVK